MAKHPFTLVKGHQVASGLAKDPRFPHGTITAQAPYFKKLGLNLTEFYPATLNAKFNCLAIELINADFYAKNVKWHSLLPAEDFKFYHCNIFTSGTCYPSLIYQPQTETKTEHFQPANQIEILAPYIKNIAYGDTFYIESNSISLRN